MHDESAPREKDKLYLYGEGIDGPGEDNMFYGTVHGDWYKFPAGQFGWPRALHGVNTVYNDDWKNNDFSKFLQATIVHCREQQRDLIFLNVDSGIKEILLKTYNFKVLPGNSSHVVRHCI
jgi:hypothetical protein